MFRTGGIFMAAAKTKQPERQPVQITAETINKLRAYSAQTGMTISAIVERACNTWLLHDGSRILAAIVNDRISKASK
jgi:hypothetical protein